MFCLRSGEGQVSLIAVQRQRFRANRCDGGIVLKGFEYLGSSRAESLQRRNSFGALNGYVMRIVTDEEIAGIGRRAKKPMISAAGPPPGPRRATTRLGKSAPPTINLPRGTTSIRRATSQTDAPGAKASSLFLLRALSPRRSGPDTTSTRLIASSLPPVQVTDQPSLRKAAPLASQ